jgi:hypothetical protein
VGEQLVPAQRLVERRHDHDRGRAAALGVHAERDGLGRRERPRPGHDRDATGSGRRRDLDDLAPLGVAEGRELPRAAAGHEPGDAGRDQALDVRGERVVVDGRAVGAERRDEGGQDAVELGVSRHVGPRGLRIVR